MSIKNKKLSLWLLILYIFLFQVKLLKLPYTNDKLQIADVIFLSLLFVSFLDIKKIKNWRISIIDKAVFGWILAHIMTCCFNFTRNSALECIGAIYLGLLYFTINFIFLNEPKSVIRRLFLKTIGICILVGSIIGFSGYVLANCGYPTQLVYLFKDYPYFGTVYRLELFSKQPIMVSSIFSVFILFLLTDRNKIVWQKKWVILMGFATLLLTLSKSIVLFIGCCFIILSFFKSRYIKTFSIFSLVCAFLLYLFATHFVVIDKQDYTKTEIFFFVNKSPLLEFGDSYLLKTGYAMLKEKAAFAFWHNPIVGVGSGNFNNYTTFPFSSNYMLIKNFDPHSSVTGILAEMGLLGFSAFVFLFYALFKTIAFALKNEEDMLEGYFIYGLGGILLYMLCEGCCTDVMNFRHYWLIFAFIAAYFREKYKI
jgi:O-Antigen ligase